MRANSTIFELAQLRYLEVRSYSGWCSHIHCRSNLSCPTNSDKYFREAFPCSEASSIASSSVACWDPARPGKSHSQVLKHCFVHLGHNCSWIDQSTLE